MLARFVEDIAALASVSLFLIMFAMWSGFFSGV
ncbi:hypothetical protein J3R73_003024 [Labrys monachus]|uniref:NADH dehydrogenase subunit 1 n=1 Tax=Labrys monachus TaxID=217067 RepID=A0ABU0FF42_9HYPH|nr:hypothetical protein [Labrys monachus]